MLTCLHILSSNLLIRLFSVKRVASHCRISQIPTRSFFQSVLLQSLETALVQPDNKYILGFASDNL